MARRSRQGVSGFSALAGRVTGAPPGRMSEAAYGIDGQGIRLLREGSAGPAQGHGPGSQLPSPRLDWLIENHLKPFFDATFVMLEELQKLGIAVPGNPRLLFNMIRLSSGGLLALGNELSVSSDIDVEEDSTLDEISDMIVRIFLPGEFKPPA